MSQCKRILFHARHMATLAALTYIFLCPYDRQTRGRILTNHERQSRLLVQIIYAEGNTPSVQIGFVETKIRKF